MKLEHIKKQYEEPHRAYHNLRHIDYMFKIAEEEGLEMCEPLEHLIYCHDAIYVPGDPNNEELSGKLAVDYYESVCQEYEDEKNSFPNCTLIDFDWEPLTYYPLIINMTKNHIIDFGKEATKGFIWNWLEIAQNLIDLDLAILGDSWEEYSEYSSNIRKEYQDIKGLDFDKSRIRWIDSMLERESIYYTDWGKKREDRSRENLKNEKYELTYNLLRRYTTDTHQFRQTIREIDY